MLRPIKTSKKLMDSSSAHAVLPVMRESRVVTIWSIAILNTSTIFNLVLLSTSLIGVMSTKGWLASRDVYQGNGQ